MFDKETSMMDRNASSRMEHAAQDAQGAQAEWLGAMQSLVHDQDTFWAMDREAL